jgi:hypothetical protein
MINQDELFTTYVILKITASISLLSIILVSLAYIKWSNKTESFATGLIKILFVIEAIKYIGVLLPTDYGHDKKGELCNAQYFLVSFFSTASKIWISCISFTIWNSFNSTGIIEDNKYMYKTIYCAISFGISGIIVGV